MIDALINWMLLHWIDTAAAAFGMLGTLLLAMNGPRAGWGFVCYLASNAGWIWFGLAHGHWSLVVQQVCFVATSVLGAWRWLLAPHWPLFREHYKIARSFAGRARSVWVALLFVKARP